MIRRRHFESVRRREEKAVRVERERKNRGGLNDGYLPANF